MNILIIAISLSLDAFSVAISKGLSKRNINNKDILKVGLYFGIFQTIMPLIGYNMGHIYMTNILSFFLLTFVGISMIKESFEETELNDKLDYKEMIILSIATSIDALVVGMTLHNIVTSVIIIGLITFIVSSIGVIIGNKFGSKYSKAPLIGGIILIIIGIKNML